MSDAPAAIPELSQRSEKWTTKDSNWKSSRLSFPAGASLLFAFVI